jgi:hypothetical protein
MLSQRQDAEGWGWFMEIITRKEALERGLKKYFTAKPCKRAHIAERWVSTKHCVECLRERERNSKRAQLDVRRLLNRDWKEEAKQKYEAALRAIACGDARVAPGDERRVEAAMRRAGWDERRVEAAMRRVFSE